MSRDSVERQRRIGVGVALRLRFGETLHDGPSDTTGAAKMATTCRRHDVNRRRCRCCCRRRHRRRRRRRRRRCCCCCCVSVTGHQTAGGRSSDATRRPICAGPPADASAAHRPPMVSPTAQCFTWVSFIRRCETPIDRLKNTTVGSAFFGSFFVAKRNRTSLNVQPTCNRNKLRVCVAWELYSDSLLSN